MGIWSVVPGGLNVVIEIDTAVTTTKIILRNSQIQYIISSTLVLIKP